MSDRISKPPQKTRAGPDFEFMVEFDQNDLVRMQDLASRIVYTVIKKEFSLRPWNFHELVSMTEKFLQFMEQDLMSESVDFEGNQFENASDAITTQASFAVIDEFIIQLLVSLNNKVRSFMAWLQESGINIALDQLTLLTTSELPFDSSLYDIKIENMSIWIDQKILCDLENDLWLEFVWDPKISLD